MTKLEQAAQAALDVLDHPDAPHVGSIVQDNLVANCYVRLAAALEDVREALATPTPGAAT